jgi:hypothetical protein
MSWWSSVSNWLRAPRSSQQQTEETGDVHARRQLCEEQRALSSDIEKLFRVYDAKVRQLSSRLQGLSAEELEREVQDIRQTQDALKRLVRRAEVSTKTTSQLERELAGWESRGAEGELHADHPLIRAELIRSELLSRDPRSGVGSARPIMSSSLELAAPRVEASEAIPLDEPVVEERSQQVPVVFLPEIDATQLLAAIRDATREAERWHGVPDVQHDDEALAQLHHVRDLHAILKRLDRRRGVRRDRLAIAIRLSE